MLHRYSSGVEAPDGATCQTLEQPLLRASKYITACIDRSQMGCIQSTVHFKICSTLAGTLLVLPNVVVRLLAGTLRHAGAPHALCNHRWPPDSRDGGASLLRHRALYCGGRHEQLHWGAAAADRGQVWQRPCLPPPLVHGCVSLPACLIPIVLVMLCNLNALQTVSAAVLSDVLACETSGMYQ